MSNNVGYCNPPEHTRFKPGQSGNPRGRPLKTRKLTRNLWNELGMKMTIRVRNDNGEFEDMILTKAAIISMMLCNKASSGDLRAIKMINDMTDKMDDNLDVSGGYRYQDDPDMEPFSYSDDDGNIFDCEDNLIDEDFNILKSAEDIEKDGHLLYDDPPEDTDDKSGVSQGESKTEYMSVHEAAKYLP